MDREEIINTVTSTMSDEDVKKVTNFLNEIQKENINAAPSVDVNDVIQEGEPTIGTVSIDPTTGKEIVTNTDNTDDEIDKESMFSDDDFKLDVDDSPISIEELEAVIKDAKTDEASNELVKALSNGEESISIEDLNVLLELVKKKQNKEEIDSPYNKLPDSCKAIINNAIGADLNVMNNKVKSIRNTMAELLIDEFITSTTLNRTTSSLNDQIEKMFNSTKSEIGDTIIGYTEQRNKDYINYVMENIDDEEKRKEALKIFDYIDAAYTLSDFKEFCKTCKIRKIDLEKPDKHNNNIDNILNKYKDNANRNIYNIYNAEKVLLRHINTEDEIFTYEAVRAFFIAFSLYCKSFNPNNTKEHAFMFYTIYNIMVTDINTGEKKEVSTIFLGNIRECIHNLICRNSFIPV